MKQRRPRVCRRVEPVDGPLVHASITDRGASLPVIIAADVLDPTLHVASERA